jgi:hypothetical protein
VPTLKTLVPHHLSLIHISHSSHIFTAKIPKLAGSPAAARGGQMVINSEWGGFNNSVRFGSYYVCPYYLKSSNSARIFLLRLSIEVSIVGALIRPSKLSKNSFLECILGRVFVACYWHLLTQLRRPSFLVANRPKLSTNTMGSIPVL